MGSTIQAFFSLPLTLPADHSFALPGPILRTKLSFLVFICVSEIVSKMAGQVDTTPYFLFLRGKTYLKVACFYKNRGSRDVAVLRAYALDLFTKINIR